MKRNDTIYFEKYFINGFEEKREYFFRIGNFNREEIYKLYNSETITKNGNDFYIELIEF